MLLEKELRSLHLICGQQKETVTLGIALEHMKSQSPPPQ